MPYSNERASRLGHLPSAESPLIVEALSRWETPTLSVDEPPAVVSRCHDLSELSLDRHNGPTFVISFDGSDQEIEARQAYPSVRVGYIQIAGVLVRVDEFLNARVDGLVDARKVQRAQTRQTIQTVLPGSQVTRPKMSGVESWRVELFETFKRQAIADFGTRTHWWMHYSAYTATQDSQRRASERPLASAPSAASPTRRLGVSRRNVPDAMARCTRQTFFARTKNMPMRGRTQIF